MADDVRARECADLAEGLTLPSVLARNAEQYGDLPAITAGDRELTWGELRRASAAAARGLASLGLASGDRMMIMMSSRPEHWIVDHAAVHLGAVPVTAYQTLSSEQITYVARHSRATLVVLEGADEVRRWLPALAEVDRIRTVVVLDEPAIPDSDDRFVSWATLMADGQALHDADPDVFEAGWAHIDADDPVAMMYTSGTTGDPKAVVLSHRNVFYEAIAVDTICPTPMHARAVAYLPLAHIAERELAMYRAAYKALHLVVCPDPALVMAALAQARPPAFFGVPRVWEKLAAGLRGKIDALDDAHRDAIMGAHAVAARAFRIEGAGEPLPHELAQELEVADAQVLKPLRAMLGLDELEWASSGSAPIPVDVLEYIAGFGIRVLEVWGMSETTGCATANSPTDFRVGSVGRPVPGVEVRIADDGEIFVRGPIVFLGYQDDSGIVQSAVDADGWLATGDIGTIDADGFMTITDRKKEIIITSSGKNIAPSKIEGMLRAHPLVGHVLAIGDRRPYLTALLTLDEEAAPLWASARGIAASDVADLAKDEQIRDEIARLVDSVNERLARSEQIKAFEVLTQTWSPESGELTPTLKMKRAKVLDQHGADVDKLYSTSTVTS